MNIELEGYNGHAWRVCNTCPCCVDVEYSYCALDHEWTFGILNVKTGQLIEGAKPMVAMTHEYCRANGWHSVLIRPQECIDKHGK